MTIMVKTGRPRKRPVSKKRNKLRAQWRAASTKFYKKNRNKILAKHRMKKK